jgi:hypothetical protein
LLALLPCLGWSFAVGKIPNLKIGMEDNLKVGVSIMNSNMNSKFKAIIFTLVAVAAFSMIACNKSGSSSGGVGQSLNSAEALKEYLDKQPANGPDKPIKVSMTINDPMLKDVAGVIKSAGKYVSLNITGNALTTIPNQAFNGCATLSAITIPDKRKMTHFTQLQS